MTQLTRRSLLGLTLAAPALILSTRAALAKEPAIYAEGGIAIDGSDAVAYFDNNGPVAGSASHAVSWNGAEWHFASAANAETFKTNPTAYAPQFGGYCAYAASLGYVAPTMPEAWTLYDGKLYLNANLRARELWLKDVPGNIAKGEANWPGILG
ncbi:YHS domain-containing (seleno)protein [uncultured Pelagimonas sp.]|uniref:YHS domain-containing (seleno)protein n=1 Tax=uncultured Pelagimonas sp. TaxID=1618102 RepID=UPI002633B3B3|nr:YHS domain-containing (seleno)protein [uncultured Pelagimonas sp.]